MIPPAAEEPLATALSVPRTVLRQRLVRAALLALVPLVPWLVALMATGSHIAFRHGVQLTSATVPREVTPGETLAITLRLQPSGPLPSDLFSFVHVESASGSTSGCRMNASRAPKLPTSQWTSSQIEQTFTLQVPRHCASGIYAIWTGLYDLKGGERLALVDPARSDQRAFAGSVAIVGNHADATATTRDAALLRRHERTIRLEGWTPWLVGLCCVLFCTAMLAAPHEQRPTPAQPWSRWQRAALLLPVVLFALGIFAVLEFVKDDAYISFRYAHNLIAGEGLVFNAGERVEGITNFLWTLLLAPFEALGLDLFQVCEVLGSALGIGTLALTARLTHLLNGGGRDLSPLWGALWLASSSSFVLYAKSGLEQPLAALLPLSGAWVLYRARDAMHAGGETRQCVERYALAGVMLGLACLTRPELHLIAVLVASPVVVDVIRARRIERHQGALALAVLAVTVPAHGFRYFYYGSLLPNTFYVKTSSDDAIWTLGLGTLLDMLRFNFTGVLLLVAPFAFITRRRLLEKSACALIALSFLAFYARVGVDEMHWHRLYIPALPFACVLAALGLENLIDALCARFSSADWLPRSLHALTWMAVLAVAALNFRTTYEAQNGFDGHGDLAGTFHPDLGKFLVRHERPGALVAFQDMGSTPYHAPDLNFLDFFGLVDATVARARHEHGLHTFVHGNEKVQREYDAKMREYFFERDPAWAILTIYTPRGEEKRVKHLFEEDPTGAKLGGYLRYNTYQFAVSSDPRFRERYTYVRTWPRSSAYYLVLFRRRDLWEQTPGEVVLDAPPPALAGKSLSSFDGGLELLGSELTKSTLERHEAFITTWWRVPGPMSPDLTFFVHVTKPGIQVPADHVPGDWMYPADRWQRGQVLEDRIVFQLPTTMEPGSYDVYVGAYRRRTGQRLSIVSGRNDGQHRVRLGSVEVSPLRPLVNHLIPPTDRAAMRAHPERIVRPHATPATPRTASNEPR